MHERIIPGFVFFWGVSFPPLTYILRFFVHVLFGLWGGGWAGKAPLLVFLSGPNPPNCLEGIVALDNGDGTWTLWIDR